ncbi:MAG: DUF362 domain-containing protein [bacterium]|nr:DUF362 domain-containing protein [bacterium]
MHLDSIIKGKTLIRLVSGAVLIILVYVDLAASLNGGVNSSAIPVSQLKSDGVPADYNTRVALVRSDDGVLSQPVGLDQPLSREQVIEMVYAALNASGDLLPLLSRGAHVVMKPNIVEVEERPEHKGVNTDPRVVEGCIRWMNEYGPEGMTYTVAEASGGWLSPRFRGTKYDVSAPVADGFEKSGYVEMQQRLANEGVQVELLDANFGPVENPLQGIRYAPVPDYIDIPVADGYWIHEAILDADVLIDIPVLKTHTPQLTACLKNHIGIAASVKYGIYKGLGGVEPGDPKLHEGYPEINTVEREIVDLASIGQPDYCLVDAIVCKERGKYRTDPSLRRNIIVAGTDLVAVDTTCARLMGINPTNVPHLVSAAREGLGTMDSRQITVIGEHTLEDSYYIFERIPEGEQSNRGHFGMGNRVWLLNKAAGTDLDAKRFSAPDAELIGVTGVDGWTEPIQFSDDFIDFESYYGASTGDTFYAFTWIDVDEAKDAELWFSHDEPSAVWIDHQLVYRNTATYNTPALPGEKTVDIQLAAGRLPLLVKLVDKRVNAPFVLNICGVLPSAFPSDRATFPNLHIAANRRRYDGVRAEGVTFVTVAPSLANDWEQY